MQPWSRAAVAGGSPPAQRSEEVQTAPEHNCFVTFHRVLVLFWFCFCVFGVKTACQVEKTACLVITTAYGLVSSLNIGLASLLVARRTPN